MLGEMANVLCTDKTESLGASWADEAKSRGKKHLLVKKAADEDKKATAFKYVPSQALKSKLLIQNL